MTSAPIGPHTLQRFRLSNGVTLVVQENHTSPSVVLRGSLRAGAIFEPADRAGLADFTAGALKRGTENRTYTEINETIEGVAASVYVSGGRHLASFGGKSLAEDFGLLVDVLADVLLHPVFPPEEVEKVRGQTITGLKELEDDTRAQAGRRFRQMLYSEEHPYGRPVGGTLESVPGLSREQLVEFYRAYFRPEGAIVVVVGDVVAKEVRAVLEGALGSWSGEGSPPALEIPAPPALEATRRRVHKMPAKSQADIVLGYVGPARLEAGYYAAALGNTILGQLGLGGRLGESVRDKQGLAYYAYSGMEAGLGPGPWTVRAGVNPANVDRAVETILAELRRFCQEPPAAGELEDAQAYLTGILPLRLETNEGIAGTVHQMELYGLGDDYIIRYPDLINGVSREAVLAAAQQYLNPERYALAIAGPYGD